MDEEQSEWLKISLNRWQHLLSAPIALTQILPFSSWKGSFLMGLNLWFDLTSFSYHLVYFKLCHVYVHVKTL